MVPVAIIDWDGTKPGSRRDDLGDFLWAFVYPALYGDGEPAAAMLEAALDGYAWTGPGIVEAMLTAVRGFVDRYDTGAWGRGRARLHRAERRLLRPAPQRLTRAAGQTGFSNGRATSQGTPRHTRAAAGPRAAPTTD
jgi:hypothetical protein